jgi:hypothetical protein
MGWWKLSLETIAKMSFAIASDKIVGIVSKQGRAYSGRPDKPA